MGPPWVGLVTLLETPQNPLASSAERRTRSSAHEHVQGPPSRTPGAHVFYYSCRADSETPLARPCVRHPLWLLPSSPFLPAHPQNRDGAHLPLSTAPTHVHHTVTWRPSTSRS